MAIASDYFLLYHGIHFSLEEKRITLTEEAANIGKLPYLALLLMISRKAFDNFLSLPSFSALCQELSVETPRELSALHALQYAIIEVLEKHSSQRQSELLLESFTRLMQEGVLKKEHYKKLLSLFAYRSYTGEDTDTVKHSESFSFKEEREVIQGHLAVLLKLGVESEKVHALETFLASQSFSVGITGVMNAGKSTMVNALLGEEILGTSVVPETANLTLLKYGKNASAKVHYWNRSEWQRIEHAAERIEAMQNYVEESREHFRSELYEYIQESSRVDAIEVSELPAYTSAEHSGKRCNLVKYVELYSDLKFLQEGVEIVDTPGLDDPVIQREEITKEYISRSDMLLHLMNVSQSATQKDVEFIIDALLYQNVSKLLIIITRADTVSQKELEEVIAYTRHSIHTELKVQNKENRLDYILQTLDFMALSGKMALLCKRDSKAAQAKGYALEKSGLPALERYLEENLFGPESGKSRVRIEAAKKQLLDLIAEEKETLSYALELSAKSKDELQEQLHTLEREREKYEKTRAMLKEDIRYEKQTLEELIRSLDHFLDSEFFALKTILRERVVSDVRYAYQTTKHVPKSSRTRVIVETALKDGLIDIVRAYRYKIEQKFEVLDEAYTVKYQRYHLQKMLAFDAESFFEDAFFQGFLTYNSSVLIGQITEAVKSSKAKALSALDAQIKVYIEAHFSMVEEETAHKLHTLSRNFIEKFSEMLEAPLRERKKQLEIQLHTLRDALVQSSEGEEAEQSIEMHEKVKKLTEIEVKVRGGQDVKS